VIKKEKDRGGNLHVGLQVGTNLEKMGTSESRLRVRIARGKGNGAWAGLEALRENHQEGKNNGRERQE